VVHVGQRPQRAAARQLPADIGQQQRAVGLGVAAGQCGQLFLEALEVQVDAQRRRVLAEQRARGIGLRRGFGEHQRDLAGGRVGRRRHRPTGRRGARWGTFGLRLAAFALGAARRAHPPSPTSQPVAAAQAASSTRASARLAAPSALAGVPGASALSPDNIGQTRLVLRPKR